MDKVFVSDVKSSEISWARLMVIFILKGLCLESLRLPMALM